MVRILSNGGMFSESKLLAIGPTARRLRVTVRWLRAEAEAGRIPHLKADARLLFDVEAVEAALLKRARAPVGQGVDRD